MAVQELVVVLGDLCCFVSLCDGSVGYSGFTVSTFAFFIAVFSFRVRISVSSTRPLSSSRIRSSPHFNLPRSFVSMHLFSR